MLLYNEHPAEIQSLLQQIYSLELKFKHVMTGTVAHVDIPLSSPVGMANDADSHSLVLTPSAFLDIIAYIKSPRDYLLIKLSLLRPKTLFLSTGWELVKGTWYMMPHISHHLPCIWRADAKNIILLEANVSMTTTLRR